MGQLERALKVVRHLQVSGSASFGDLVQVLAPASRTTVSKLLAELEILGEIEHYGRDYRSVPAVLSGGANIYELPIGLRTKTHPILVRLAHEAGHSCALFARVGVTTMKIMDQSNLDGAHWSFSPAGYEWPLLPFHGFAKMFLAHASAELAQACYGRWQRLLHSELMSPNWNAFQRQLKMIRKQGYALEYQEERSTILRLVVPVPLSGESQLRFAVGFVARHIYLLEIEDWLHVLRQTAEELTTVLDNRVPAFHLESDLRSKEPNH